MPRYRTKPAVSDQAAEPAGGATAAPTTHTVGNVPVKPRRRPMLLAGAVGLVLTGGLASLFVVQQLQTQNHVVELAHDIPRGATIGAGDLTTTTVGSIAGLSNIPAAQLTTLIGKHALVDLKAGSLLPAGAIGDQTIPKHGDSLVGISLAPGKAPTGTITPGSPLRIVITPPAQGTDALAGKIYKGTMITTATNTIQGSGVVINVEVSDADAPTIGTMSAANRVVVIKEADR